MAEEIMDFCWKKLAGVKKSERQFHSPLRDKVDASSFRRSFWMMARKPENLCCGGLHHCLLCRGFYWLEGESPMAELRDPAVRGKGNE